MKECYAGATKGMLTPSPAREGKKDFIYRITEGGSNPSTGSMVRDFSWHEMRAMSYWEIIDEFSTGPHYEGSTLHMYHQHRRRSYQLYTRVEDNGLIEDRCLLLDIFLTNHGLQ